jgi:glycosyltransferase involved in cell wall biosynthesis
LRHHSVIINAIPLLSKFTGIAKYTFEISKRILLLDQRIDATFYYGYFKKKLIFPNVADIPHEESATRKIKRLITSNYVFKKVARQGMLFSLYLLRKECDLYWEPNIVPIKHINSKHLITTIHDLSFLIYPDWHPKETREYFKKHFLNNVSKSDRIITVSHFIKNEISELLHFDPSRIHVINNGVDHDTYRTYSSAAMQTFRERYTIPQKFILFVGSIEPRKNLKCTLLAYNALPEAFKRKHKFILAGFSGWKNAEVMEIIRKEKGNIVYLGYLSEQELAWLYNLASVFIYPSFYEGFGLPPLEAMSCGTPVIVSRVSAIPEICGEAAYYVDPMEMNSISEGIYTVATNDQLRNDLSKKGIKQAEQYSWDKSAQEHLKVFKEVLPT